MKNRQQAESKQFMMGILLSFVALIGVVQPQVALGDSAGSGLSGACVSALQADASGSRGVLASDEITTYLRTVTVSIPNHSEPLYTQVYVVKPRRLRANAPVVFMPPGLTKPYFKHQAELIARRGMISVSYDHINFGDPVVGPIDSPTVADDTELASQVYDQLPRYTRGRDIIIAPHSRGGLVGASVAHKLADRGANVVGMIMFQSFIYWQLEHVINEFSAQFEERISRYLRRQVPFLFRLMMPLAANRYDNSAEMTASSFADMIRSLVLRTFLTIQSTTDLTTETLNLPSTMYLAIKQVLPDADHDVILRTVEKLKGMEFEFLGDYLLGLEFPILMVGSQHDDLSTPGMALRLEQWLEAQNMQNVEFTTLLEHGHYFPYDHPEQMAEMVREFSAVVRSNH